MKPPVVLLQIRLTHKQYIAAASMLAPVHYGVATSFRELSRSVGLLLPLFEQAERL